MENRNLPAFAAVAMTDNKGLEQEGLTKREYFSASALQGMLANPSMNQHSTIDVVQLSIEAADELLKQLEESK